MLLTPTTQADYRAVVSAAVLSLLLSAGCTGRSVDTRPTAAREGSTFVYLQPLSPEVSQLSAGLESISAIDADGEEIPLSLAMRELGGAGSAGERLLASGSLPPGRYLGLLLRIGSATSGDGESDALLLAEQDASRIDLPFSVSATRGVVLSVRFDHRASLRDGYRFTPVFSGKIPTQPPRGLIGLASNRGSDVITLFDKVTGRVTATIPTGREPAGMAMTRNGTRAFLAVSGEDALEVVDLLERRIIDRVRLSAGDRPTELAITPDGGTLLVVNPGSNTVSVIDPVALFELQRTPVGDQPSSITMGRLGRRAYVFNTMSDTISILQAPDWSVVATIATDLDPVRGQLNRDGSRLYVIHRTSPILGIIDLTTLETLERIYVGSGATALVVDSRTDRIYLARRDADVVDVYEPSSLFLPVNSIATEGTVAYMAIDGEGDNLHLVLPDNRQLRIVRIVGEATVALIDTGDSPYWVTFPGEG